MTIFSINNIKLLEEYRYLRTTNAILQNFKVLPIKKRNHSIGDLKSTQPFVKTEQSKIDCTIFIEQITRKYSFFSKKYRNFPVKCKIRTNECGQKVAEPYVAKEPSCINIPHFSKDFTMNPEEKCSKLQEKIVTFSPSPPECMHRTTQKCSNTKFPCPNALTKYLKTRGECKEVYRGIETGECKKKNSCSKIKKATYTGRDCALDDPCKTKANQDAKTQSELRKPKQILENLLSKLKSGKLMKSSGFFDENLIREACSKAKIASKEIMTCVKNASDGTSNCEKSTDIEFGVQNLCKRYSSGESFLREFDESRPPECEVFQIERDCLLYSLKKQDINSGFSEGMSKSAKTKKLDRKDEILQKSEGEDREIVKSKKTLKKVPNKPKSKNGLRRFRKKPRWFSKIPIEPNIKGSVIFANGTAQVLDDPCKILSVNFSASNLQSMEESNDLEPKGNYCNPTLQSMMNNYDYVIERLTSNCVPEDENFKEKHPKNEKADSEINENVLVRNDQVEVEIAPVVNNLKQKKMDSNFENKDKEENSEPIVRQKKISKLDKTIKCFTTTVLPEKSQTKKRQKRVKKRPESSLKQSSTEGPNSSLFDLNKYSASTSDAFGKGYHAMTTNNLLLNLEKRRISEDMRNEVEGVRSENSFIEIKEISTIYDSGDEKDLPNSILSRKSPKNGLKKDHLALSGINRPATQKNNHLNLLESKALTPVSSSWKKIPVSSGKMKDKGGKTTVMSLANKLDAMEIKGVNYQQNRMKSTERSALSWKSKCDIDRRPCPNKKKNYDEKADAMYPLPTDWDYEERVPEEIARKWNTWECPKEKEIGCPVTSEDLKKGPPNKKPVSAAAINRCNLEECKNRMRCRRPVSRCRNTSGVRRPLGPGK
ncbi:uncharacterized protein LOC123675765 isoform X2 [Harmonia axyridis]|uniref:uncharacterized protein LOC123675765 isoform X2 n=1 Tax=Harmonia axyridis TaxID=115357 RepID=UPI001E27791E|nr:uncharacterized protein LOC123675765 isoform X2 [Harmonia axyridis]